MLAQIGNQKLVCFLISHDWCFCTTWYNTETRKLHIYLYYRIVTMVTVYVAEETNIYW